MKRGVKDCDLFILIGADRLYGAMVELGIALAHNKEVLLVDNLCRDSIFFAGSGVIEYTIEEVYRRLNLEGPVE